MGQIDFHYGYGIEIPGSGVGGGAANDPARGHLAVSIYADRGHLRDTMREDAQMAGFSLGRVGEIADLASGDERPLGDVVLLDCPIAEGTTPDLLAQLDTRAAQSGAQLVVATSMAALDHVFCSFGQSNLQILVEATRSERLIALGVIIAKTTKMKVRDLSEDDRVTLLKLAERVSQIADRLDGLSGPAGPVGKSDDGGAFGFESPGPIYNGKELADSSDRLVRAARPALPDPRLVRRIIRQRQLRARFFDGELFADPGWDMLLDLTAARAEHKRVSVTSLCIASGVPPTTALRWIAQMKEFGLFERVQDEADKRRAFIALTDKAADAMARYFAELEKDAKRVI